MPPPPSPSLIRFTGPWTRAERRCLEHVIAEKEHSLGLPPLPAISGPPWIATKFDRLPSSGLVVYAVSRWHLETLSATSFDALCRAIQTADAPA